MKVQEEEAMKSCLKGFMLKNSIVSFVCRHKTESEQIEKIAKDANDTSTKAYNLLLKTLEGESRTGQEIEELNRK